MMDVDLLEFALFASGNTSSFPESGLSKNISCPISKGPMKRRLFTPLASFSTAAVITYLLPIICALGIIGNIITFVIIKESAGRIVGHFYIQALTILDSLSLIFLLPAMWTVLIVRPYHHHLDPYSYTFSDYIASAWGFCQARLILTFFTRTLSIYTIVLFSFERCIQVTRPFLGQRICNVSNAKKSMIGLVFFGIVVNIHYIFAFDKKVIKIPCRPERTLCKTNDIFFQSRYFKMALLSVFPSFIILICNILILVSMRRSRGSIYRQHSANCQGAEGEPHDHSEEKKQNREITFRLILVSSAFFILNMPLFIVTSAHNYYELTDKKYHLKGAWADAFYIALLLFVVNLSINFILYCFTGRMFRKAALSLVLCRLEKMRSYRSSMTGGSHRRPSTATRSTNVPRSESTRSGQRLLNSNAKKETEV